MKKIIILIAIAMLITGCASSLKQLQRGNYDEAIKTAYKRTPMARTQVSLIQVLTELSKGHGRGIIVSQDPFMVDKDLLNPVWCRALFLKGGFSKRDIVEMFSLQISGGYRKWRGIPRTTVKFDPYLEADFSEMETEPMLDHEDLQIFYNYIFDKMSYSKIGKNMGKHPYSIQQKVRKVCRVLFHVSLPKADEVKERLAKVKDEP